MGEQQTMSARRRDEIREEIGRLVEEYSATWAEDEEEYEAFAAAIATGWVLVADVLLPTGVRSLVQLGDAQSSRFHTVGLLYSALQDSEWTAP